MRPLTPRETQIIEETAEGLNAKQIAAKLGTSHRTVEIQRGSAVLKLNARNTAHAVALYLKGQAHA